MSCTICTENFNQTKHANIKCIYCEFSACRTCCETYIINEKIAKCMNTNCEKEWTRKFLVEHFTKKFINNKWKENLEQVGLEKEKALLPATQGIVEQLIERERIKQDIDDVDRLIRELYTRRSNLSTEYARGGNVRVTSERRQFVRACPDEHCRGFLSTAWKCGLCSKWTCPDCHVLKGSTQDAPHECKQEDLETARLLDKDTKPCPKCAIGIFKIEGCDQMWCTQCHTAFSWRSGRIETHIHNPHFYEWQRRNNGGTAPRNVGDFQCGREIDHYTSRTINNKIREMFGTTFRGGQRSLPIQTTQSESETVDNTDDLTIKIDNIVRSVLHLQRVQMPTYQVNEIEDNQYLRIDYLRRQINEEEFKIKIQRANKLHQKKREIGGIIHLFIQSITDIMYRLHDLVNGKLPCNTNSEKQELRREIQSTLNEINGLLSYTDECFQEISRTYSCKQRKFRLYNERDRYREVLITA